MTAGLHAENITILANQAPLLKALSFHVDPGSMLAISGPSGCGKTTLLRALAGLIDLGAGSIELNGKSPDEWGWPQYRRQAVYLTQRPILFDDSVMENLRRPFTYDSATSPFPDEQARSLLTSAGVDRPDQNARSLSEGQQQRVHLIRALLLSPKALLLDEPTSALDPASRDAVEALVRQTVPDAAILVVTHDHTQAERWCDTILDLAPYCCTTLAGATA